MTRIAELRIEVNSNQVEQSVRDLDRLKQAAQESGKVAATAHEKAAQSVDKRRTAEDRTATQTEASAKREARALDATVSRLDTRIKAQLEYNRTVQQLNQSESSGSISTAEKDSYLQLAAARRDAALAAQEELTASQKSRQQADRLLGSLDKQVKAKNEYAQTESQLNQLREAGIVSEQEYSTAMIQAAERRDDALSGGSSTRVSEEERLQRALDKTVASLDPVAAATQQYEQSISTLNDARQRGAITEEEYSTRAAQASDRLDAAKQKSLKSSQTQEQQLNSLVSAIDPYAMELQRLVRLERELDTAQKGGQFDNNPQEYQRLSSLLATNRRELERRSASMQKASMSAKQLQQAQLQLPMQFTDIAVSLQSGQNPLTVFLQQGGQLKDVFGGIVPALKAMTGYVVGLINPFTVLAATTVALAVAWRQADKEAENINRAVLLTGTSFNFTAEEVRKSAENIADATGVSIGAATNHLLTFVEAGKVTRDSIESLTSTAIKLSKLGVPIEEATSQLSAIGDDPVKAVVDLNEKYGILTATIYDQAAALVEQGREQEAVELVAEQAARDLETRSAEIITRYNSIGKAAKISLEFLAEFWDGVRGVFRGESGTELELKLGDSESRIDKLRESLAGLREGADLREGYETIVGTRENMIALQEAQLAAEVGRAASLRGQLAAEREVTAEQNEQLNNQRAAVSAASAHNALRGTFLSQEERIQKQLEDNEKRRKIRADDANARLEGEERANALQRINNEHTEAQIHLEKRLADAQNSGGRSRGGSANLDTTGTEAIKQQLEATRREYESFQQGIDAQRRLGVLSEASAVEARIRLLDQEAEEVEDAYNRQLASIDQLLQTESLSSSQRNTLANRRLSIEGDLNKALQEIELERQEIATNEKVRLTEQATNLQNYVTTLQLEYEKLAESGRQEAALITIGGRAAEAFQERLALEEDFLARKRELDNRRLEDGENFSQDEYNTYLAQAEEYYAKSLELAEENARAKREAEQDWVGGARAGLQDWLAESNDVAGQVRDVVSGAFDGMTDALHEFVTTGKLDFRSFASSIISDMARIAAQAAASQAVSSVIGGFAGGGTGNFMSSVVTQADGGVWEGGVQKFAKGGAFTNSVVASPTMFSMGGSFGGGLGVMGEAGPEAIMPLQRGPDGSLGVVAHGATGGQGGVAVYITIDEKGNQQTSSGGGSGLDAFGKEVGNFVEQKYTQLVNRDLKPGGQIYGAINSR